MSDKRPETLESAFPRVLVHGWEEAHHGMTLRDYFAATALQGWLSTYSDTASFPKAEYQAELAEKSYAMADAMLKERSK